MEGLPAARGGGGGVPRLRLAPECSGGMGVLWGAAPSLGGHPLKAALTPPAARRPGLSRNPDLQAEALNWLPPIE